MNENHKIKLMLTQVGKVIGSDVKKVSDKILVFTF